MAEIGDFWDRSLSGTGNACVQSTVGTVTKVVVLSDTNQLELFKFAADL